MTRRLGVVMLLATLVMAAPAYADDDDDDDDDEEKQQPKSRLDRAVDAVVTNAPAVWRNTLSAISRVRRSIAIGPHVGPYGAFGLSPTSSEGGLSFGLALYTFDIPTALDWEKMIKDIVRVRAIERIKAIVDAGGVEPADLEGFVRQVAEDVKEEVAGKIRPKALEGPRWKFVIEGTALLSEFGWGGRIGVSRGLKVVSLGIGAGVQRTGGETTPLLGAELSLHLTPIGQHWTPVLDFYIRIDQGLTGERPTYGVVGLRALLDLL